jgi:chaperonin GroES
MIKPLSDRVVVRREKKLQKTASGLFLPESSQEKSKIGQVLSIGPGKLDEEGNLPQMLVQVGDRVLFGAYAGAEVKSENADEELLVLRQDELLAILKS